jgi:xanthine dehydrogenase accessory factor
VQDVFDQLDRLAASGRRVALATLVDTRGTTPRKEGAKMLVGEQGELFGSVTIGGCVDARVIAEADDALAGGAPRLVEMSLGADEAAEIGLSCGGAVEVVVEPIDLSGPASLLPVFRRLRALLEAGGRAALVTPLDERQRPRRLLVLEAGAREGTLGEASLDAAAAAAARDLLRRGASRTVTLPSGARVFVESYGPPAVLVIVGATQVAIPLTALARAMGFRTLVIDARPRFATRERFPDADEIRIGIPSDLVAATPLTPATALILLAHDYKYEVPILRHALSTDVGYVGMLGSRRRGEAIRKLLGEHGVPESALARLRVPIGLNLGGDSPAEIALAVLAEVQSVRASGTGLPLAGAVAAGR